MPVIHTDGTSVLRPQRNHEEEGGAQRQKGAEEGAECPALPHAFDQKGSEGEDEEERVPEVLRGTEGGFLAVECMAEEEDDARDEKGSGGGDFFTRHTHGPHDRNGEEHDGDEENECSNRLEAIAEAKFPEEGRTEEVLPEVLASRFIAPGIIEGGTDDAEGVEFTEGRECVRDAESGIQVCEILREEPLSLESDPVYGVPAGEKEEEREAANAVDGSASP